MADPPARPLSRHDLIDDSLYTPRLQVERQLSLPPRESPHGERTRAAQAWEALRASQDERIMQRAELDKLDRAVVRLRKEVHAARADALTARGQLEQAQNERLPKSVVVLTGGFALLAGVGWWMQRRRLIEMHRLQAEEFARYRRPAPAQPPADDSVPNSQPPTQPASGFHASDLEMRGDEADQWIAQGRLTVGELAEQRPGREPDLTMPSDLNPASGPQALPSERAR